MRVNLAILKISTFEPISQGENPPKKPKSRLITVNQDFLLRCRLGRDASISSKVQGFDLDDKADTKSLYFQKLTKV